MRNLLGIFAVVGVMSVFLLVTLWAADWIQNYDETGRYE
tara:strand:+ start:442 stop:558 length:117 start_codon:yes stop_codon:yes gene_type:complete